MRSVFDKRLRELRAWRRKEELDALAREELVHILIQQEEELHAEASGTLFDYGRSLVLKGPEHPDTVHERARMLYMTRRWATLRYEGRRLPAWGETKISKKLRRKR